MEGRVGSVAWVAGCRGPVMEVVGEDGRLGQRIESVGRSCVGGCGGVSMVAGVGRGVGEGG